MRKNRSVRLAESLDPLRERPFRLLFLGRGLSGIGDALVPVALTFAVLEHGDATDLGIVLGAQWGARMLFLVAGGVWADRLPRQLVMMGADVLRAVVQGLVALAFFADQIAIWQLAVASALLGIGQSFFNPASTGLVPSLVHPERLQEANALLGLARSAIQVAGPALSGLMVATLGFGIIFAIDAATFAASFLCLAAMRLPTRIERTRRTSVLSEALEGLRVVRAQRWIIATLCCDVVFNIAIGAYFVLGPVMVEEHLGGAGAWGLIMTAAAIGGLVGGAIVLRLKPSRPLLVGYGLSFVMPLQLLALARPLGLPIVMVGAALTFGVIVVLNTFWTTAEQQYVPADALSRVDSLSWFVSLSAMPLSMVVAGPLSDVIGVRETLIGAAALATLGLTGVLAVREVRHLERKGFVSPASVRPLREETSGST
jgi:MFS family permease